MNKKKRGKEVYKTKPRQDYQLFVLDIYIHTSYTSYSVERTPSSQYSKEAGQQRDESKVADRSYPVCSYLQDPKQRVEGMQSNACKVCLEQREGKE